MASAVNVILTLNIELDLNTRLQNVTEYEFCNISN